MKPELQLIEIARACGLTVCTHGPEEWEHEGPEGDRDLVCTVCKKSLSAMSHPDYLTDLNAMHEAEKTLTAAQRMDYAGWIFWIMGAPKVPDRTWDEIYDACHVGAGIKAEAFLRASGKWREHP